MRLETDASGPLSEPAWNALKTQFGAQLPQPLASGGEALQAEQFACLALALQNAAGANLDFHTQKATIYPNIINVVFAYESERAGKQAARSALTLMQSLLAGKTPDVEAEMAELRKQVKRDALPEPIANLINQAKTAGIPVLLPDGSLPLQLGYGRKGIDVSETQSTSDISTLFPAGEQGRIPLIAITGSNGKTTTTRLIAHIIGCSGKTVGFTTSDGIYIGSDMVDQGDTTGPASAEMVLRNKSVDVAVLETARGGIVRAGLGFDQCDIAVVTNVQDDHLGISDIETMDELCRVKGVVVSALKPGGTAVLNADNPYTLKLGSTANGNCAWFSMNPDNPHLTEALTKGATVACIHDNALYIRQGTAQMRVAPLSDIPITFNGRLGFMTQNALAACLAAYIHGVPIETMHSALASFLPSAEQTPGRMNIFSLNSHKVLIDFAHNPDGFAGIRDFLKGVEASCKIGIIVGTGDRKDGDIRTLGAMAAEMFDIILIQQVKFLRGRSAENIVDLLAEGIETQRPGARWERIPDDAEALAYALALAPEGSFITALSDVLNEPEALIASYRQSETQA